MNRTSVRWAIFLLFIVSFGRYDKEDAMATVATMINITSTAFKNGQPIPKKYSGEGQSVSPPLAWEGFPKETKEFALICDDPDAPMAEPFVHWVLYKIPANRNLLPEGSAAGAIEGKNSAGKMGYAGPMPPPGHGIHHYHFKLYALDQPLNLKAGATKADLLKAMSGHTLAEGEIVGTYQR